MSLINLFSGFAVNLVVALLLVRFIYYPAKHDKNYVFTYMAFNTVTYFVMSFLATADLALGAGFGLFAVFTLLRYRTVTMSPREMTYLFIVIALPVLNSIAIGASRWDLLLTVNAAVLGVLAVLEREWGFHYESSQMIRYERLDLLKPQCQAEMLGDLRERTGLPVKRVEVGRLNFLNDSAEIKIYFDEPKATRRAISYDLSQPED